MVARSSTAASPEQASLPRSSSLGQLLGDFFAPPARLSRHPLWLLWAVSFAALYVEVLMIRWIGTEIRVFAYFQNLALIACFLGFGLGCFWSERRKNLFYSLAAMSVLVAGVQLPLATWHEFLRMLSSVLSLSPDAALWGIGKNPAGGTYALELTGAVIAVACFLLLLVIVMVPLGQWVGFYLDHASRVVTAYSVNLLGSLAGIWVFAGMAFLWLPPRVWFAGAFAVLLWIERPRLKTALAGAALLALGLWLLGFKMIPSVRTLWSPYQKLDVRSWGHRQYTIYVNNTGYMTIANMTPALLARNPNIKAIYRKISSYDAPFRFASHMGRVLIVGAGAGNDAAAALRNGARHVDAVEIDPVIYHLGLTLHPEHPYRSPRVRVILTDARAFLRRPHRPYDVIVFGLLDSHTEFSDFSNMRIDNYVYTRQAFREAQRQLAPGGILVVKFEVRYPWEWMGQRFYAMLDGLFGRPPVVFFAPTVGELVSATVFIESNSPALWERAARPPLAHLIASHPPGFPLTLQGAPPPATDNWPYVYNRGHFVPRTYLTVSVILLALAALLTRGVLEPKDPSTWHFFFLGAGFLLLETQMVSRLALYFGATWIVNCVALSAILSVLLVANLFVERSQPRRLMPYYVLLIATLIGNYLFPWESLPYSARTVGLLLSAAYAAPIFFAGVVFTEMFRRSAHKATAFGSNIVGAVAGGLAENLSFVFGMKLLLVVAAVFYLSAALCGRRLANFIGSASS